MINSTQLNNNVIKLLKVNKNVLSKSTKGYFRENSKSQNINPISHTTKSSSGIIQLQLKDIIYYTPLC